MERNVKTGATHIKQCIAESRKAARNKGYPDSPRSSNAPNARFTLQERTECQDSPAAADRKEVLKIAGRGRKAAGKVTGFEKHGGKRLVGRALTQETAGSPFE